jgi:hypothetical protein
VFLFASCGFDGGDRTLEEIAEHDYQVDPSATLSLSNEDGSIRIYGADIKEIKLQAIKKAYSAERLSKISVNVSAGPDAVSIETSYPPKKRWGLGDRSGTVDYILVVPQTCKISKVNLGSGEILIEGMRGESVDAHLKTGRLFGHNCFGRVHLSVVNGGIDIFYDWWEQRKFSIEAEIENGGIHAFIPSEASFHLIAETEDGRIANDFAEKEQRHADDRKIDMLIGAAPEPEVKLLARDGNVMIVETNP